MIKCKIPECENPSRNRGWCHKHYKRWQVHGDPNYVAIIITKTPQEAFKLRSKVLPNGCLLWTGAKNSWGYGTIRHNNQNWVVHRLAWVLSGRTLLEGQQLNHKCWEPACFNIDHLEVVTQEQNSAYRNGPYKNNTSGYRNVVKSGKGWRAQVGRTIEGKRRTFARPTRKTIEEAVKDAEELRQEHFGNYAGIGT